MKISLNKIRFAHEHYGPEGLADGGVDSLVEKIGAQLGEVEEVIPYGNRFNGITIAKVVSCVDHSNADRLHVCKIDDGGKIEGVERDENGFVQVVCGAPNVREGLLVAWLPPGTTVPESVGKDPFVLEARELRGVVSNGMLASAKELTIGDNHDGILEVDVDATPGTPFTESYRAEGEMIIDIENKMFTHRPDCFGTMGVIREIAGIQGKAFKSPDWYTPNPEFPKAEADELKLTVENELPELVPRFTAVTMSGIEIKPSPVWMQIVLSEVGVRPINNIVDWTNFYMLETGQPLHAYDYDKVKNLSDDEAKIVIRPPKKGEEVKLLNGKEIEPRAEAIMIATDQKLIGIGGVMGGSETEVDENTKNIIVECANFDMYSIRRTSMELGLFTDAVTRFTKGQSPLQNLAILAKVTNDIRQYVGGKVASALIDDNHVPAEVLQRGSLYPAITVTVEFVNARLGLKLSDNEIATLLRNVEFAVKQGGDNLTITAPFWRTDIELPEDIVEEVGRLYGYDKLPLELPKRSIKPAQKDELLELKSRIRRTLAKAGANEVLTYSFVHGNLLEKVGQDPKNAFKLSNALSPDLQYYRLSLTPSLLEKVHPNIKSGHDEFAIFELGKAHNLLHKTDEVDGVPPEFNFLDMVYASSKKDNSGAAYYKVRKYLDALAADFGLELTYKPVKEDPKVPVSEPYDLARSAFVAVKQTDDFLGMIGEFKPLVRKNLKLPERSAGFCIGPEVFLTACRKVTASRYVQLPKFPKITQDITLKVASDLSYQDLATELESSLEKSKPSQTLATLEPLGIYQSKDDKTHKNISFRLEIASYEKTLVDAEVTKLLGQLDAAANTKFKATRV